MSSYNYAESHKEFNKDNRFWIAHRVQEIYAIIRTSVFPMPSHIWEVADGSVPSPAEYMITL